MRTRSYNVMVLESKILFYYDDPNTGKGLTRVREERCVKVNPNAEGDFGETIAKGSPYVEYKVEAFTNDRFDNPMWVGFGVTRKLNKADRVASKKANYFLAHECWPENLWPDDVTSN